MYIYWRFLNRKIDIIKIGKLSELTGGIIMVIRDNY